MLNPVPNPRLTCVKRNSTAPKSIANPEAAITSRAQVSSDVLASKGSAGSGLSFIGFG